MAEDRSLLPQFVEWALNLSDEDLRQALEFLAQEYKLRVKRAEQLAAMAFREGEWVEMVQDGRRLPAGAKGHIVKIRRGRLEVHFPDHGMWTVSATMLRKAGSPPPQGK